jgi:hypothetical protein
MLDHMQQNLKEMPCVSIHNPRHALRAECCSGRVGDTLAAVLPPRTERFESGVDVVTDPYRDDCLDEGMAETFAREGFVGVEALVGVEFGLVLVVAIFVDGSGTFVAFAIAHALQIGLHIVGEEDWVQLFPLLSRPSMLIVVVVYDVVVVNAFVIWIAAVGITNFPDQVGIASAQMRPSAVGAFEDGSAVFKFASAPRHFAI